jgi:hypothetical protein
MHSQKFLLQASATEQVQRTSKQKALGWTLIIHLEDAIKDWEILADERSQSHMLCVPNQFD